MQITGGFTSLFAFFLVSLQYTSEAKESVKIAETLKERNRWDNEIKFGKYCYKNITN